jgi:hypothetical protein
MATIHKRLALTIPPEVKKIYEDTAKIIGIPASRLIVQIMIEAAPSVKQMGDAYQQAKNDPVTGLEGLAEILQGADKASADFQHDIEDQIKKQRNK